MDTVRAVRVSQGYRKYHERCNGKTSDPKCLPDPDVQFILRILLDIVFLAWAWLVKPKAKVIIPKFQPLSKQLRKTPSKSAKYRLQCIPLRQKIKRPLKIKIRLGLNIIIRFKFTTLFGKCAMLIVSNCSTVNFEP